ncbi:MAG: 2-dehydropantoate 2-reductase [Novosphingobium sp.]|nr:2-dehydropantoate 2-reductase [Novosphingobium sp.]
MKICIYGAGAIGGFIAARLSQVDGVDISVVARGANLEAIKADGLHLVSPAGDIRAHVRASDDPGELGIQDYVFLTLKSHQITPALPEISKLVGPQTAVLPPTTGIPYWYFHGLDGFESQAIEAIDPGGAQWKAIPGEKVLGVAYWLASEMTGPGVVHHDGNVARIPVGEPDGTISERTRRLSQAMIAAGIDAPAVPDIRSWIWIKMISSLSWNPVAVLTRSTLGEICAEPRAVAIIHRMMEEADAVASRLGAVPPMTIEERIAVARDAGGHKMSMLQDVERGRPLEVDVLLGSLEAMRDIVDLQTPTIDDIYTLAKLHIAALNRNRQA